MPFRVPATITGARRRLSFEDVTTELKPGMVVSMEPMIMLPEGEAGAGGYREHDILIIPRTGPRTSPTSFGTDEMIVGR